VKPPCRNATDKQNPPRPLRTLSTLCAVVTLGAGASPVAAQSSATLYGIVDTYLGFTTASGKGRAIGLDSPGFQQSRIGVRVSEDLGNGWRVNAMLENGFALNTGAAADPTRAFSRQAWVGLSGAFGEARAGRQNSPQYLMLSQLDAFVGATFGSIINNASNLGLRYDNALTYVTPTFGGFKAQGLVSLGGQTYPHSGNNVYVAMLDYSKGPWYVGVNHAEQKSQNANFTIKSTFAVTNFDYGHGKVYVAWYRGDNPGANGAANVPGRYASIYSLSADWRISPALTLGAGGGWIETSGESAPRAWQAGAIGTYALSKRTLLYSSVAHIANSHGGTFSLGGAGPVVRNVPTPGGNETGVQIGMRQLF
jgi:predicted porin